ncbi:MAG TPA: OmpA family protein [Verrucomicrobiae bacterium]|nr:OmpA family protein [Verrucomicrobiae bacterium]
MRRVILAAVCLLAAGGCANRQVAADEPLRPAEMAGERVGSERRAPGSQGEPAAEEAPGNRAAEQARTSMEAVPQKLGTERTAPDAAVSAPPGELRRIHFDFDSAVLSEEARQALQANAERLRERPATLVIAGHCDERGSDEYNLALGEKRARAAMEYLLALGVPEERVSFVSYGEEMPLDPGHDEDAWAKNRRDEFELR